MGSVHLPPCLQNVNTVKLLDKKVRARIAKLSSIAIVGFGSGNCYVTKIVHVFQ